MKLYLMFVVFLLSSLHGYEVEGTRLARVLTLSTSTNQEIIKISSIKRSNEDQAMVAKTDELPSRTALKNRKLNSKVVTKKSHHVDHWFPKIHEDYYGPKHHRPRHH
ncbi:putative Root meristem growth factor 9 [Helianthus anomalus]